MARPLWRRVFDAVDHEVTPRVDSLVRTSAYARVAAVVTRVQADTRSRVGGLTAGVWHLVNLPAATDVAGLRAQIGALDREVRRLTLRLEQAGRSVETDEDKEHDADGARPPQRAGARPARRGTQRPAGP